MNDTKQNEWNNPLMESITGIVQRIKPSLSSKAKSTSSNQKTANTSETKNGKYDFDSQGIVNVSEIKNGIICCADGTYVKILEVLPINYYQKETAEKNQITDAFLSFFRTCPDNIHIKARTEKADTNAIINKIRENYKKEKNPLLAEKAENYIKHIKSLRSDNTVEKKFYIIYSYEGENGKFSKDFIDIYRTMKGIEADIRSKMIETGNIVVSPNDENYHACEVLYKFYNPKSSEEEPLQARINRIVYDFKMTYGTDGGQKEADFIAPRGLSSKPLKDWIFMDGMYHTWLVLKENSYPPSAQTGWLDNIPTGMGVDVDIFSRRRSRGTLMGTLNQMRKYKYSSYNANVTNLDKSEKTARELRNIEYVKNVVENYDEDVFAATIIVTIRNESYAGMRNVTNHIKKHLDGLSVYTSTSFLTAHEYLKTVAPDMYMSKSIVKKYSHDMLTRNMAQLYPFTSLSLFDNEGSVIGRNANGGSLISFNNFNTQLYSNANIAIMGSPGSGKSFLQMMLAYRMRMVGIRTMFILPLKAHEYYHACKEIGGEYIKFIPGGENCVNIMEIRPQVNANGDLLEDTEDAGGMDAPLLARKIASLCAWLQLNMIDDKLTVAEKNRFNVLCTKLYANYGITSNNDSIWQNKEKKILKNMPILQDLNDALKEDPVLSRVKDVLSPYMYGGIFSNFNGPTNVNLNNQFLVFDVDKTSINEDYLPAMMYIAFDCCYDLAKQSLYSKDALFLDEVWLMMQNEDCAKQVNEMVKIIRGYGACTVLATQNTGDFLKSNNGIGESVLISSKIKFFLRTDEMEINNISRIVNITARDRANFRKFPPHGRALMIADQDKMLIDMIPSKQEINIFTTDVNIRRELSSKKKNI